MAAIETSPQMIRATYDKMGERLALVRSRLARPLVLAEKILLGHLDDPGGAGLVRGESYVRLRPDRVAMQDATAQMALLQFMLAGRCRTAVPATVHCDHLIRAEDGAAADTERAEAENGEVYEFLASAAAKYGIGFWKPGAGIIHQVLLENYAFPGGLMIGTDSHTPNAGGLGMCACGVGGADAVDVMAGGPWELLLPRVIGVRLTGSLSGWATAKDIILRLCGLLTVKGGTNMVIEYFGPGTGGISATGKATICNMGAELGATCSVFPFDHAMERYLRATGRGPVAEGALAAADLLVADAETADRPEDFYDQIVEMDLSSLEPYIVGPHSPDLARPISELAKEAADKDYPEQISTALIGSCTNSSYQDISQAADIARQATAKGMSMKSDLLVTPGSDTIHATVKRDGQLRDLQAAGARLLANACGPCIGQWQRRDLEAGRRDVIVTSFNRNFRGRNDGNPETLAFIASPQIVTALGLAGSLAFNPLTDTLESEGKKLKLEPPAMAAEVPALGFAAATGGYVAAAVDSDAVKVVVRPESERLALLEAFAPPDAEDFERMALLVITEGKTTTDHISPAGPWLRFRGHLDRISDNMFLGALARGSRKRGTTRDPLTGESSKPIAAVARGLKAAQRRWVVVGDENYGEGSSREHAAMSPRHLGAAAIVARGFARIHETNLKKQGVLPLTFADPSDYQRVREDDELSLPGIFDIEEGKAVSALLHHAGGGDEAIELEHSLNQEQINWWRAGSALNLLTTANAQRSEA